MNTEEMIQKGFSYIQKSKLGQLFAALYNLECTCTWDKYTIKITPYCDIYLKISAVDESISNKPYEVKFYERVKGNTFRPRNTEYWELKDILIYVIQNCDG